MRTKQLSGLISVLVGASALGWLTARPTRPAVGVRVQRSMRVWRLSARNSARFVWSRVRRRAAPRARRAELDERFAIRTAADVSRELGQMKGLAMKVGQMMSFILETLPDEARQQLATLQNNAPPMAPSLAASMVESELGQPPERLFLEWSDLPAAAASIGQVHRAVDAGGHDVAVKVQYPGIREAISADLGSAELVYAMVGRFLKGLDRDALTTELRERITEELDYGREADSLREFAAAYGGHPWVRIPAVFPELSSGRVLTTDWIDGLGFDDFVAQATPATKQRAAEVVWRFVQHGVHRRGVFQGDPNPGNYLFHHDGSVTFLDFGLVKRFAPGEWDLLRPTLEAVIIDRDPDRVMAALVTSGFLTDPKGLDPTAVYEYLAAPYEPYLVDGEFQFDRDWMRSTVVNLSRFDGSQTELMSALNVPASYLILNRVVWGTNALMSRLEARGPFRAMLLEYVADGRPATDLGAAEQAWSAANRR